MMALETCFRAWALDAPAGSKDKLLIGGGSAFAPSNKRTTVRRARLVCQASNALNEGTPPPLYTLEQTCHL
jgi:hypothetical protein